MCLFLPPKTVAVVSMYYGLKRTKLDEYLPLLERYFKIPLPKLAEHAQYIESNWGTVEIDEKVDHSRELEQVAAQQRRRPPSKKRYEEKQPPPTSSSSSTYPTSTSSSSSSHPPSSNPRDVRSHSMRSSAESHSHSRAASDVHSSRGANGPPHRASSQSQKPSHGHHHPSSSRHGHRNESAPATHPHHSGAPFHNGAPPSHSSVRHSNGSHVAKRKEPLPSVNGEREVRADETLKRRPDERSHRPVSSSSASSSSVNKAPPPQATASAQQKPRKAPQKLPCPRCKIEFTKTEYEEHKAACKEKYHQMWKAKEAAKKREREMQQG